MRPAAVEFLVHMSLCAAVSSVNSLSEDGLVERESGAANKNMEDAPLKPGHAISRSEHVAAPRKPGIVHQQQHKTSITGADLNLQWRQCENVEYLTDGGNSWIHTAVFNGKPVVVKTLKPECQDVALAINEIEGELGMYIVFSWEGVDVDTIYFPLLLISNAFASSEVHSRLNHPNIVGLFGAGLTSKGVRFVVLERCDGGTLTQMLGYDTRIRDRRRRFWRKKQFSYLDVLRCAREIASAMQYCHESAIPGSIVLHRDLKPDNIGE
jgi:serine/threonine protein kinase